MAAPTSRFRLSTSSFRLFLFALLFALGVLVPDASAQVRRVEILNADHTEVTSDSSGGKVYRMRGNVRFRQDTTSLRASAAVYDEGRGEVALSGNVRIVTGTDTLTAREVAYDANTRVAVASGAVRIADGESVLLAPRATFDRITEVATFEGGGRILHRGAVLTAPSGSYATARRFARLDGPVTLTDSSGTLTAARGTYDARVRRADFAGAVRLRRPDARLDADSVVYFRRTERARAYRHVVLERLGAGRDAAGQTPADSSRRTFLFGEELQYDGQAETARIRGDTGLDPLLLVLRRDSTGRVDSTLARAPRLDAARTVVAGDTVQTLTAAGGARLWQTRLAAVADSARFTRVEPPGAAPRDRLGLYGASRPSVWARGTQLTGDTLLAVAHDERLDSLRVVGTSFAGRLDSLVGRVQQIRGGQMLALFRERGGESEIDRLTVWPQAEAFYYSATADSLLDGATRLSADRLTFRFDGGDLRRLDGDDGIQGTIYGPRVVPEGVRLSGYAFDPRQAPTPASLLDPDGWEAAWLREHAVAPGRPAGGAASPAAGGEPPETAGAQR